MGTTDSNHRLPMLWWKRRGDTVSFLPRRELLHDEAQIAKDFGAFVTPRNGGGLKYLQPNSVMLTTLMKIMGCAFEGKAAHEFYLSDLKPRLDAIGSRELPLCPRGRRVEARPSARSD